MTRHLLALIALLSGFAALTAPANATAMAAFSSDVDVSAGASDNAKSEDCRCPVEAAQRGTKCPEKKPAPNNPRLPEVLRLPVLMGIERAYE